MALTVPQAGPHTDAVIACLETAGLTVGNASGAGLTVPYAVVYTDEGILDGPMGDRFADIAQAVFVHGIGEGADQAQWVTDKARTALLTTTVTVTGRKVDYVAPVTSNPVRRDDAVQPPLFVAVDQYTLATTPA